ncbi:class I SAM-dependent methyltransferase [Anditalea andensis]|uniref:SAM-dependent methyltransferase n=1 Tax=Anditalea andensis TaxID=1048983 RepID=A0A074LKX3_9BACT|nr:class I SAM-dependent methyltransferase [Anditalea andensis]KEO74492.1 SAM-dependent methyltransferase [Anditalea andensis]
MSDSLPFFSDEAFDSFYPMKVRKLSSTHWTPIGVAIKAVIFLVKNHRTRVLDLGSGAGKFCVVAAMNTDAHITGVEQRAGLVFLSRKLALHYKVENVSFIHSDIKEINFRQFDSFYFFNSFEENLNLKDKIDADNNFNPVKYLEYFDFLKQKLDEANVGTRVVTYYGDSDIIPESYIRVKSVNNGKLLFWEKKH